MFCLYTISGCKLLNVIYKVWCKLLMLHYSWVIVYFLLRTMNNILSILYAMLSTMQNAPSITPYDILNVHWKLSILLQILQCNLYTLYKCS